MRLEWVGVSTHCQCGSQQGKRRLHLTRFCRVSVKAELGDESCKMLESKVRRDGQEREQPEDRRVDAGVWSRHHDVLLAQVSLVVWFD